MIYSRKILVTCLACLLSIVSYAQWDSFIIRHEDGFPYMTARCVAQDNLGFIWIGMNDGLVRFDGERSRHYTLSTEWQQENIVTALYADDNGLLWVGTESGLFVYDNRTDSIGKFTKETSYGVPIACRVNVLSSDGKGNVLVGTNGQGLFIYGSHDGSLRQESRHASMVKALCYVGDSHIVIGSEEGTISEMMLDGTWLRTLYADSKASRSRNTDITAMYADSSSVWVGFGQKGFCHIDLTDGCTPEFLYPSGTAGSLTVKSILHVAGDNLLIGAQNGLFVFNVTTREFSLVHEAQDFHQPFLYNVNSLYLDRGQGIWMATQNSGLNYIWRPDNLFRGRLGMDADGQSTFVYTTSFCEDGRGDIWIGTMDAGLMKIPAGKSVPQKTHLDISNINCLLADGDDIWIGSATDGIYVYNTVTGNVKNYRHSRLDPASVSDNCINALFRASNGRIYVGTEWGLGYFNRKTEAFRLEPRASNRTHVSDIHEDSKGNIWIATHNEGIYRVGLDGKNWTSFGQRPNIPGTVINDIYEDFEGRVWVGTSSGLCYFDRDSSRFFMDGYFKDVLGARNILSIEQDYRGNLWISMPSSLCCMNPDKKDILATFDKSDGMQCYMFEGNCSLRTSSGKMLFGGSDGYNEFDPADFTSAVTAVAGYSGNALLLTGISVNNEPLGYGTSRKRCLQRPAYFTDGIRLDHSGNSISVDWSTLDYRRSGKISYDYILEGQDREWIKAGNATSAEFNNLNPGKYVFRVRAFDNMHNIGETSLSISIMPPFYMTGWAFAMYVLLIAAFVAGISMYLSRRRKQESYEAKIDFYTNITHEIRTPLTLIKVPLEKIMSSGDGNEQTRSYLNVIKRNTDNMLNLINQLLDYRKGESEHYRLHPEKTDIAMLLNDISGRFKVLAESDGKKLELETDNVTAVYEVDPEAMSKIVNNLLSNAVKYAKSLIKVTLVTEEDCYRISVFNDGSHIASEEKEKIFKMFYQIDRSKAGTGIGLPLAKMLAEKHGGTVGVSSGKGGTEFGIYIPVKRQPKEPVKEPAGVPLPNLPDPGSRQRQTILIVDDNEDLRQLIAELLKEKYDIVQAGNGKEGIDVLENHVIDLILSDIVMPKMDGNEFCEFVKSDIRYSNIPFVHISVKSNLEDKIKGLEYGADDYIGKPFSPELLRSKIKTLLDNRKRLMEFYRGLPVVHPKQVSSITKGNVEFIQKLNSEIAANLSNDKYNVEMMAKNLYMSQSSLYRKMMSLLDMSPNEYIKDFRLKKAAEMLSSGKYLVGDIYALVGFNSVSYFSTCFKKKFGISATQYIESVKKGDAIR
ncbi:MAG: response regulator [Clostridium sp.]|nr:response regulator [Bacteroides sp.]MCM1198476.1 response regulator [Clostridium sp.]